MHAVRWHSLSERLRLHAARGLLRASSCASIAAAHAHSHLHFTVPCRAYNPSTQAFAPAVHVGFTCTLTLMLTMALMLAPPPVAAPPRPPLRARPLGGGSMGDYPPPGTALVEELDQRLLIQLRDGRKVRRSRQCRVWAVVGLGWTGRS